MTVEEVERPASRKTGGLEPQVLQAAAEVSKGGGGREEKRREGWGRGGEDRRGAEEKEAEGR